MTEVLDGLASPNQYAVGDIVQLKSGGPKMTVTIGLIDKAHGGILITDQHDTLAKARDYHITFCSWFDKQDVHHHYGFATATLMRVDTEEVLDALSGKEVVDRDLVNMRHGGIGGPPHGMGRCQRCGLASFKLDYYSECPGGCDAFR